MTASRMMALLFGFLFSLVAAEEACLDTSGRSCAASDAPQSGSAMLQLGLEGGNKDAKEEKMKIASKKAKDAPMKGRLDTVNKEISSLKDRVATVESEVGVSGAEIGGVGGEALALA